MKRQLRATEGVFMNNHKLLFVFISAGLLFSILCLSTLSQTDAAEPITNYFGMKFNLLKERN